MTILNMQRGISPRNNWEQISPCQIPSSNHLQVRLSRSVSPSAWIGLFIPERTQISLWAYMSLSALDKAIAIRMLIVSWLHRMIIRDPLSMMAFQRLRIVSTNKPRWKGSCKLRYQGLGNLVNLSWETFHSSGGFLLFSIEKEWRVKELPHSKQLSVNSGMLTLLRVPPTWLTQASRALSKTSSMWIQLNSDSHTVISFSLWT